MNALTDINVAHARLPATYEAAKAALAECTKIDECTDWADKAAALASYARQSNDQTLFDYAKRIQGRAVRRSGELLKQFDGRGDHRRTDGADSSSQRDAAHEAGMSERQQVTAVRVAKIPEADFNDAIESETPPTITKLADMGKTPRPADPSPPEGWREATALLGEFQRFAEFCEKSDPTTVARGVLPHEIGRLEKDVATADAWLDTFIVTLSNKENVA